MTGRPRPVPRPEAPLRPAPAAIVVTGFGPFPGTPLNLSADLVTALAADLAARFPRRSIVSEILETRWDTAPERVAALHATHRPALVLHFGVSDRARGFVLETCAVNRQTDAADAAGRRPGALFIEPGGPGERRATVPADRIAARLRSMGLDPVVSEDAGTYLCNRVLYASLAATERQSLRPDTIKPATPATVGFVHMPSAYAGSRLDPQSALAGAMEIVRACLGLPPTEPRVAVNRR